MRFAAGNIGSKYATWLKPFRLRARLAHKQRDYTFVPSRSGKLARTQNTLEFIASGSCFPSHSFRKLVGSAYIRMAAFLDTKIEILHGILQALKSA